MRDRCRARIHLGLFPSRLFEAVVRDREGEEDSENGDLCCQQDTNNRVESCHPNEVCQLFPERKLGNSTEQVPEKFVSLLVEVSGFWSFHECAEVPVHEGKNEAEVERSEDVKVNDVIPKELHDPPQRSQLFLN